jgi:hypothetical protein
LVLWVGWFLQRVEWEEEKKKKKKKADECPWMFKQQQQR